VNTVPPCASTSDVPVAEAWSSLPGASRDPRGAAACQHKRTADGASVSQHRRHERERCRRGRTREVAAARERSQLHAPPHALVHTTLCTQARAREVVAAARERSQLHARGRSCTHLHTHLCILLCAHKRTRGHVYAEHDEAILQQEERSLSAGMLRATIQSTCYLLQFSDHLPCPSAAHVVNSKPFTIPKHVMDIVS
jgi:hypothetical protein